MPLVRIAALLVLAGCAGPAPESTPEKPTRPREDGRIRERIEKLSSSSPEVRAEAHRELVAFGEEALPALREAERSPDPEVSERARLAAAEIEREMDRKSVRLTIACDGKLQANRLPVTATLSNAGKRPVVVLVRQISIGGGQWYPSDMLSWSLHAEGGGDVPLLHMISACGCSGLHPLEESQFAVLEPGLSVPLPIRDDSILLAEPPDHPGVFQLQAVYEIRKPALPEEAHADPRLAELWGRVLEIRVESNRVSVRLGD